MLRNLPISSSLGSALGALLLTVALTAGCSLQDFDQFGVADQGLPADGSMGNPDQDTDMDVADMNVVPDMGPLPDFGMGPFDLDVTVVGGGTVTSVVGGGIDCGGDCTETYADGTQVILSATPNAGSVFTGWTGACTGDQACVLDLSQPLSVTATFEEQFFTLDVTFSGSGMGTIDGTSGLSCDGSGACTMDYPAGTEVTLSAAALTGSAFSGWSGDCGDVGDCVVTLDQDRSVGVTFDESGQLSLLLSKVGTGTGSVTSAPVGIDCGATCSASFDAGMMVTLTAVADATSTFEGWSGDCTGSGETCEVTLSAARSVSATFTLRSYVLDVQPAGTGSGTVESTTPGIDCGSTCSNSYTHGTSVTLVATEDVGSTFMGWSGGGCSGTSFCTVEVTAATTITAQFELDNYTVLASTTGGSGTGRIVTQNTGIDCPGDCTEDYDHGTMVTFDALADTGSTFDSWGGACAAQTGDQCVVTVTAAATVTAAFTQNTYDVSVTTSGDGAGTVTSTVGGIDCPSTCMATLDHGTMVTFTAMAGGLSSHIGWGGDCSAASGPTCTLAITGDTDLDATFILGSSSLSVIKAGDGGGTVTGGTGAGGVDGQINCGATCASGFTNNDMVTLTAVANTGSTFTGWSGEGCTGTGTCEVTISAAASVTATFTAETYPLDITRGGAGTGTVNGTLSGSPVISCGSDCTETVTFGTMVTLSAVADSDSVFAGWSGGGCSGTGPCTVDVEAATTVDAQFALRPYLLSVGVGGNGNGSVNSAPSGISCGSDCEETYLHGDMVTLTATPGADSVFAGWAGGGCSPAVNPCVVSMTQARSVTAAFTLRQYTLTVNKTGNGSGNVSSDMAGITCGGDCSEVYNHGAMVVLTAAASTGSTFTGWTGGGCESAGTGSCTVTVTAATSVQAAFVLEQYTVTTSTAGSGGAGGSVSSNPGGISCGSTCEADFNFGTALTLTATPDSISNFTGWTITNGTGTCAGNSCDFMVSEPITAQATFELKTYTLGVSVTGDGSGGVTGTGISCGSAGSDCSQVFDHGTMVSLTQSADSGSNFVAWGGACSGTGSCVVTMDQARNVTASFAVGTDVLTVTTSGTGNGTVISDSGNPGINCDSAASDSDCSEPYTLGTNVTLTATADDTSVFVGWDSTGPCASAGSNPMCTVEVNALTTVGAQFDAEVFQLDAELLGSGDGFIQGDGIDCPGDCSETFESGTEVFLVAFEAEGSRFVQWHGACSGEDPSECMVTMDQAHTVGAEFELLTFPLSVGLSGGGNGSVTSNPTGIDCGTGSGTGGGGGTDCSEDYEFGTTVTLTATPAADSDFAGWSYPGCGSGPCVVDVTEAEFVDAFFELKRYVVQVNIVGAPGLVDSGDGSIQCGSGGQCSTIVTHGTVMSLFPTDVFPSDPVPGAQFDRWVSAVCNGGGNCSWVVTANMDVDAEFIPTREVFIDINAGIANGAKVDVNLGTILFGTCTRNMAPCSFILPDSSNVLLSAQPTGSFFRVWSGDPPCDNSNNPMCGFFLNESKFFVAMFF